MAESNFYAQRIAGSGVFAGRTLIQANGEIGGKRYVFVKLVKGSKDGLVYPTTGGKLVNPFKGNAKIFAGDLIEYDAGLAGSAGPTVKILKSFEVNKDASASTAVTVMRDGFRHVPFVGDNIMLAPAKFDTKGLGVTVTAVEKTVEDGKDVYKLTVSAALTVKKGDVIVEASAAGASVAAMVTNPNAYAPCDYDFVFNPAASDNDFEGARYLVTPCLANADTVLYTDRMSPLPTAVKALNRSRVAGWFWFE